MDVSVILVSYNTRELTENCLKSVFDKTQEVEFEVYVVDNNSQDGSCELIEQEFPRVKLIKNKENKGFGAANNLAIRDSKAKYVFLLNTDTILLNNAVKVFFDFMEKPENYNVGSCGGNLYSEDMTHQASCCHLPGFTELIFRLFYFIVYPIGFLRNYYKRNLCGCKYEGDSPREVGYICGANMFLRKSALDKTGLFDPDFFLYFEETELSFRLKKFGYRSMIIPGSKIIHLCGRSEKVNKDKMRIFNRSRLIYFEKCYGKPAAILTRLLISITIFKHRAI